MNAVPLWWRRPPAALGYLVAPLSVAVALIAIWWMNLAFQSAAHVSLFLCAVMFSAWFGGVGPGLFATGTALLAFNYFHTSPTHSFGVEPTELPHLGLFAVGALFVVALTGAQRAAVESLLRARDTLQQRSRDLEEINRVLRAENTERTRAEYLNSRMLDTLTGNVAIIGRDYRFWLANQDYEEATQMPAARIVGAYYPEVMGEEVFALAKPLLDRCFSGERVPFEGWFPLPAADGRRYIVGTCSPFRPSSDAVEAALVIGRDFTESVQAAEALRDAQAKLEHVTRVATLGELTASLAHEVNQPLSGVTVNGNTCLRWLAAEPPNLDEAREAVRRVIRDSKRANEVIARIRALTKNSPPTIERVDLNDAIREVVALAQGELQRNRVEARLELVKDLPSVRGDRVQLQQVALNLVMNSIEAMAGTGLEGREVVISTRIGGDGSALVAVKDHGVGLDPDTVDRLFEAFYTTKSSGMGMGLSICRSIVTSHGGRLWACANDGAGATFQFTIPPYDGNGIVDA